LITIIQRRKIMTTPFKFLMGSILLLTAAMASAQTERVAVSVPFMFVVGFHTLPAGEYTIEMSPETDTMAVRSGGSLGEIRSTLTTLRADGVRKPGQSRAVFQRYGNRYFLAEVWSEGTGQMLIPGQLERKLGQDRISDRDPRVEAQLSAQ
jgi:hypothetical protein